MSILFFSFYLSIMFSVDEMNGGNKDSQWFTGQVKGYYLDRNRLQVERKSHSQDSSEYVNCDTLTLKATTIHNTTDVNTAITTATAAIHSFHSIILEPTCNTPCGLGYSGPGCSCKGDLPEEAQRKGGVAIIVFMSFVRRLIVFSRVPSVPVLFRTCSKRNDKRKKPQVENFR
jgi:hypothetical protein